MISESYRSALRLYILRNAKEKVIAENELACT